MGQSASKRHATPKTRGLTCSYSECHNKAMRYHTYCSTHKCKNKDCPRYIHNTAEDRKAYCDKCSSPDYAYCRVTLCHKPNCNNLDMRYEYCIGHQDGER